MSKWYDKYLSIYGKSFDKIPDGLLDQIQIQLAGKQNANPLVSVVVIAYNEDQTEKVDQRLGLPYFNEEKQSPGYARQCGLNHSRGKYHFCIDADTFYPPHYVDLMMDRLTRPNVSCVSSFWSFFPDEHHSRIGLFLFELARDSFLYLQHFKRPELCVRGMVFAFNAEFARKVEIRTNIRRGEDGSLALSLKPYGKISFLYNRKARPVTGYGTLSEESLLKSFINRVKVQMKGISRVFYKKEFYEDCEDNLM